MATLLGKRIRIVFDDHPAKTKVMDAETGDQIKHIHRVEIVADAHDAPKVIVHLYGRNMEVEATVTQVRETGRVGLETVGGE